jgi:tetratricopeptide (TPR) repeat protein
MRQTLAHRISVSMRPLVVILLYMCAWATFPPARADQNAAPPAEPQEFLKAARRAIAHGQPAEAESLARKRPGADAVAAAVLGQIEMRRGKYDSAVALLEPAAAQEPAGEAALTLGLLHLQLGRSEVGTRHLTSVYRQNLVRNDPEFQFRAARAAQALRLPREAKMLFQTASARSDPAVDTAWGLLFLEKYNKPDALRSF